MITEKTITIGGGSETVYLFGDWPNMDGGITVKHALRTTIQRGLTDRESRWWHWGCIRTKLEYVYDLEGTEAADVRTMLYDLGKARSVVPLWHDYRLQTDWANRFYDPQYVLDVEAGSIVAVASVGSIMSTHHVVPVVLCRFERPKVGVDDIQLGEFPFTFTEQAPWDWRCDVRDKSLSTTAWPSTVVADYVEVEDQSKDRIEFTDLGSGREPVVYGDQAPMRWGQQASFTMQDGELGDLLSFYAHVARGRYHGFTVDQLFKPHEQASEATPDGYMARLAEDELVLEVFEVAAAETTLRFWQVPWELNPPDDEEFEAGRVLYLYEFARVVPDGTTIYNRFTNGEESITVSIDGPAVTFTPTAIGHGNIEESMDDMGSVDIEMAGSDDNPLVSWYRREGEGRLILMLYEYDGSTVNLLVRGELGEVSLTRNIYQADFGNPKSQQVPRVLMQRLDNHSAYSDEGGIAWSTYAKAAEITQLSSSPPRVYFTWAGGSFSGDKLSTAWLTAGAGETYEERQALNSGYDGDTYLELDRPLVHAGVGDTITIYPGYDRTWTTCRNYFDELGGYVNFLGFPFLPVTDPSVDNGAPEPTFAGKK